MQDQTMLVSEDDLGHAMEKRILKNKRTRQIAKISDLEEIVILGDPENVFSELIWKLGFNHSRKICQKVFSVMT